ncbi:hypothetical protein HMPREF0063_12131 [Aeromicrobium marinum DSM 15272]|uniref:Uncharacterized protein n=1 Tax=Aeromicrobium marinum DSM 15272 TaxID=585531 RepID=E2SCG9_9ACTN|nr:hypothetical protein [Aeromicrobium marinum]EFQ82922.1 hypothetical protein HMPREF0063_12131 [Aeromicrobium marinum DSM 15272]
MWSSVALIALVLAVLVALGRLSRGAHEPGAGRDGAVRALARDARLGLIELNRLHEAGRMPR